MNFNKQNSRSYFEILSDQQFGELLKSFELSKSSSSNQFVLKTYLAHQRHAKETPINIQY